MDHKLGYVIKWTYSESVGRASPYAGASEAGEMGGKYRVPYKLLGPHFDDPFDTKSPGFRRTVHALDEDWLVRRRPAVRAARRSALLVCTMRDDSVAGGKSNVAMVASGLAA